MNIREAQLLELELMKKIDFLCKKNNIYYFLFGGALLGAVRNGGFIPWDDDIDIGMMRDDYLLFSKIAQKELGDQYFVQYYNTDKYTSPFKLKIRILSTEEYVKDTNNIYCRQGFHISVFPFDYAPEKYNLLHRLGHKIRGFHLERISKQRVVTTKAKIFSAMIRIIPTSYLEKFIYWNTTRFNKRKTQNIMSYFSHGQYEKSLWPARIVQNVSFIEFEGEKLMTFNDYLFYLKHRYGDYMTLPPENERVSHVEFCE